MKTAMYSTQKKKINWLFLDENSEDVVVTVEDFQKMVLNAEKDEGMSLSAYKEKMDLWWQKHLF